MSTHNSGAGHTPEAEDGVPVGWVLISADFSIRANDGRSNGFVMLRRDHPGLLAWFRLDEAGRDAVDLYVRGEGMNLRIAIADAASKAIAAGPVARATTDATRAGGER